ncbi:hypothetical protein HFO56_03230 [Rhizobium laguerreae]|uniref:hypothetical protein n=1 Tax=Rhizobium laguerreae TaxID=1076926 RepID=UPI001C927A5D|nr:hypothetical protein [Rhizobium laguerreae]MBY3151400.1 hypothetical protein [Rhizobium laguerreae]
MRYSREYDEWATRAEARTLPSDRERAAMTVAKIRNGHSGSSLDSAQLERMEKLAGYSSGSLDWPEPKPKKPPAPAEPELIPGKVDVTFTSDEFDYTDTFCKGGLSADVIESAISSYLAGRNDLDYTIHGFEPGGRLTKNTFKTKVKVSDYDPDEEKDFNHRSILITGSVAPAKRKSQYYG